MTSGGTSPSTCSMTKNGEPIADGSGSSHHTRGTGTPVSSPTRRMASNWRPISYDGNTGTSDVSGAIRATKDCSRPDQRASNRTVSLDIPVADVLRTSPTDAESSPTC